MEENKVQPNDKNIKVLRTYTSDMADAIRTNEVSMIKIVLAEKNKREQELIYKKAEGTTFSKIFLLIGGIILIAAAIFGSYFLFQKKEKEVPIPIPVPTPVVDNVDTFISYDLKSNIDVTGINTPTAFVDLINKEKLTAQGQIKTLFLEKKVDGIMGNLSSKDFFTMIQSTAPSTLIRSLSSNFLLGKYLDSSLISENKDSIFIIFQTNNYDQTYASMLDWEKTMLNDLKSIFDIKLPIPNGKDAIVPEKLWRDVIIDNRDARVIYGDNGEGILYYVFVNKNNLLIASNIETIKEIVERLIIKNTQPL